MTDVHLPPAEYNLTLFEGVTVTWWEPVPLPKAGQAAFDRFLALPPSALAPAARHVFAYCKDMMAQLNGQGWPGVPLPNIARPEDVWAFVSPLAIFIQSDWDDDGPWYVGIEANVLWEVEHGLAMIWEGGQRLVKVGGVDGHLTNANSYADPKLQGVVYPAIDPKFRTLED